MNGLSESIYQTVLNAFNDTICLRTAAILRDRAGG